MLLKVIELPADILPWVELLVPHLPVPYPVLEVIEGAVTVQLVLLPVVVQDKEDAPMLLTPLPLLNVAV